MFSSLTFPVPFAEIRPNCATQIIFPPPKPIDHNSKEYYWDPAQRPVELGRVDWLNSANRASIHAHPTILLPPYAAPGASDPRQSQYKDNKIRTYTTAAEIQAARRAGAVASYIRAFAGSCVQIGRTTEQIDNLVHAECVRIGYFPSPLGYANFPRSLCTSINQVVCHGIPSSTPLKRGDIINIDVSAYVEGFHGDCSAMFIAAESLEECDEAGKQLIAVTKHALYSAIAACGPNKPYSIIGDIIQAIAENYHYSIVKQFCGHGIGRDFHLPPFILHYKNSQSSNIFMQPGHIFTIEPMLNEGAEEIYCCDDGWTIVTKDNRRSAQFEETILITQNGVEILTKH
jgi:methionyl aminopeptidase